MASRVGPGVLLTGWVGWEMRHAARRATVQLGSYPSTDSAAEHRPRQALVPHQLPAALRQLAGRQTKLAALTAVLERLRVGGGGAVPIARSVILQRSLDTMQPLGDPGDQAAGEPGRRVHQHRHLSHTSSKRISLEKVAGPSPCTGYLTLGRALLT